MVSRSPLLSLFSWPSRLSSSSSAGPRARVRGTDCVPQKRVRGHLPGWGRCRSPCPCGSRLAAASSSSPLESATSRTKRVAEDDMSLPTAKSSYDKITPENPQR